MRLSSFDSDDLADRPVYGSRRPAWASVETSIETVTSRQNIAIHLVRSVRILLSLELCQSSDFTRQILAHLPEFSMNEFFSS
jgi:hypothetical protein